MGERAPAGAWRAIRLGLAVLGLGACISAPRYSDQAASRGADGQIAAAPARTALPLGKVGLAVVPSDNVETARQYLSKLGAPGQLELTETVLSGLARRFKTIVRAQNLESARSSGADLVGVLDARVTYSLGIFDDATASLAMIFTQPDGEVVETVSGAGKETRYVIYAAIVPAIEMAAADFMTNLEQASGLAEAARRIALAPPKPEPAAAPRMAAKPAIFVVYPKGGEEVAEPSIRLIGYVTSLNRTGKLKVFLNKISLSVEELWNQAVVETAGLRGYPLDLTIPLQPSANHIEIRILDEKGFLETKLVSLRRIELDETGAGDAAGAAGLPARLADVALSRRDQAVTTQNFMAVLASWVKETAKSDYNKGNSMYDQGRFVRAAYYFAKAIRTEPTGRAHFNLGLARSALGQADAAGQAFAEACALEQQAACALAE
jgi:hypothetical protein